MPERELTIIDLTQSVKPYPTGVDDWPRYGPWKMQAVIPVDATDEEAARVRTHLVSRLFKHWKQGPPAEGNRLTVDVTLRITDKVVHVETLSMLAPEHKRVIRVDLMAPICVVEMDRSERLARGGGLILPEMTLTAFKQDE